MGKIVIDVTKCIGCGACTKVCTAGAIKVEADPAAKNKLGKLAKIDTGLCTMCSTCLTGCRFGAISMDLGEAAVLTDYHGVFVFCEMNDGDFAPVAYELLGKGRELADSLKTKLSAVYVYAGDTVSAEKMGQKLISYGADRAVLIPCEKKAEDLEETYADAICALVNAEKPEILLFGATMFGRSLAPRVAAGLRTGLTADCTVLAIDPETNLLQQTRPAFGGNLMATIICPKHRPQMATVRPGIMKALEPDPGRKGEVVTAGAPAKEIDGLELLEIVKAEKTESIKDAKIIIDCGRGVGSKKNLKLVKELCEKLGAAYGCSRPLVDTGLCEYPHQVGQTGCTVAPDLLICLGVSGAIQHLAGITNAKKIIAVNNDPDAPIFAAAHYKVVADCMDVVKEMLAQFVV